MTECIALTCFVGNYEHIKVNKNAIFANSELSLKYIDTYGFDYDYTLASYTTELHRMLYNLCKERLVSRYKVSTYESLA